MFEDLAKDIKAQLYEKARSPLAAAFIGAWLVINIRIVLVFFSELHVDEKIAYFDAVNPALKDWMLHSVIYPLGSAILILLIYPHMARLAYEYWQRQYLKVKKIQQKIEDETPLTQEEANALRKSSIEQQINLESQLSSSSARNTELQLQIDELRKQLADVNSERATFIEVARENEKLINELHSQLSQQNEEAKSTESSQDEHQVDPIKPGDITLPGDVVMFLKSRGLTEVVIRLFAFISMNGGQIFQDRLLSGLKGTEKLDVQHAINSLVNKNFAFKTTGGDLKLTDNGLSLAVDSGLTKALKINES